MTNYISFSILPKTRPASWFPQHFSTNITSAKTCYQIKEIILFVYSTCLSITILSSANNSHTFSKIQEEFLPAQSSALLGSFLSLPDMADILEQKDIKWFLSIHVSLPTDLLLTQKRSLVHVVGMNLVSQTEICKKHISLFLLNQCTSDLEPLLGYSVLASTRVFSLGVVPRS